ncbi:hypothetical protein FALBO_1605 [Fusarium albosuccineum]|uniref:Uncharacterized protein n=1 Tax=Fusarium albosuccineum TaxID=1237068 RepID=A0A8H4PLX0_9HYPO|nr:hypothetical protein FALBO_1605 [Fusarium albosuccineum]
MDSDSHKRQMRWAVLCSQADGPIVSRRHPLRDAPHVAAEDRACGAGLFSRSAHRSSVKSQEKVLTGVRRGESPGGETERGASFTERASPVQDKSQGPWPMPGHHGMDLEPMFSDGAMDALVGNARGAPAQCKPRTHTFSSPVSWADEHLSIARCTPEIDHEAAQHETGGAGSPSPEESCVATDGLMPSTQSQTVKGLFVEKASAIPMLCCSAPPRRPSSRRTRFSGSQRGMNKGSQGGGWRVVSYAVASRTPDFHPPGKPRNTPKNSVLLVVGIESRPGTLTHGATSLWGLREVEVHNTGHLLARVNLQMPLSLGSKRVEGTCIECTRAEDTCGCKSTRADHAFEDTITSKDRAPGHGMGGNLE